MSKENNKKKKGNQAKLLYVAIMLLIGFCGGLLLGKALVDNNVGDEDIKELYSKLFIVLAASYFSFFIHIILHEAGHLVFGLMTGYKFSSFRIGSFMWVKKDGKIVLRRFSLAGTGGQCLMAPPDYREGGHYPFFWYNVGGCISNVVFSAIAIVIAFFCKDMAAILLWVFAVIGIACAILNGIPVPLGGVDNDGANTKAIAKSDKAARGFWVMMKVNEQSRAGVRIKDMPEEWFTLPAKEAMNNTMVSSIAVFRANRLMDACKFDEARALMEELIVDETIKISPMYKNLLKNEILFCELIGENREDVVEEYMADKEYMAFTRSMKKYPSVVRTFYAYYLLSKKDEVKAKKSLDAFNKIAAKYPNQVEIDSERELLELALNKST